MQVSHESLKIFTDKENKPQSIVKSFCGWYDSLDKTIYLHFSFQPKYALSA